MLRVIAYNDRVSIEQRDKPLLNGKLVFEAADEDSFNGWIEICKQDHGSEVWKYKHLFLVDEQNNVLQRWFVVEWLPQNDLIRLIPPNPEIAAALARLKADKQTKGPG